LELFVGAVTAGRGGTGDGAIVDVDGDVASDVP
jgi:hypothetical protein